MKTKKLFLFIPLAIIAGFLIYCWTVILTTDVLAVWRHYVGLLLFLILIFFYFRSFKRTVLGTGIYLLLATFNMLAITADISTSWIRIGPIETPPIQWLSLGLFILFAFLNYDELIELYLDYKEFKQTKAKRHN